MEFAAEPESSCNSASEEEAVTRGENERDCYKPINTATMEKEIFVFPLTDGFVLVIFRIERVSKIREFKNLIKQEIPINC